MNDAERKLRDLLDDMKGLVVNRTMMMHPRGDDDETRTVTTVRWVEHESIRELIEKYSPPETGEVPEGSADWAPDAEGAVTRLINAGAVSFLDALDRAARKAEERAAEVNRLRTELGLPPILPPRFPADDNEADGPDR